jgi:hypothetical protein
MAQEYFHFAQKIEKEKKKKKGRREYFAVSWKKPVPCGNSKTCLPPFFLGGPLPHVA